MKIVLIINKIVLYGIFDKNNLIKFNIIKLIKNQAKNFLELQLYNILIKKVYW
jgi:hypothetical protein